MNKIVVAYWKEHNLIPYFENNYEFEYSPEKRNEIIGIIIESGYNVMTRSNVGLNRDTLLIYIGKGKFSQS